MLELTPIGYVRTSLGSKVEAARQPRAGRGAAGRIELLPARNFEHALADLDAWDYITGLALRERATATLALGPEPHPYRRIRREQRGFTLAVKEWRLRFEVSGRAASVITVASGYRTAQVAARTAVGGELAVHREFRERWSATS